MDRGMSRGMRVDMDMDMSMGGSTHVRRQSRRLWGLHEHKRVHSLLFLFIAFSSFFFILFPLFSFSFSLSSFLFVSFLFCGW